MQSIHDTVVNNNCLIFQRKYTLSYKELLSFWRSVAFYWIIPADLGAEHSSLEEFQNTGLGWSVEKEMELQMHRFEPSDKWT